MKITHPVTGPRLGSRRRVGPSSDSDAGSFGQHVDLEPSSGAGAAARVAGPSPLASLGGVLSAQEVPDGHAERHAAVGRGHNLLDELHQLRLGLIQGWVSEGAMRRLADLLDRRSTVEDDAELASVLDEIEVRAAVEVAKRQQD